MKTYETGFYWVRILEEWTIAHYDNICNNWIVVGDECTYKSDDFNEIGDKIINHYTHCPGCGREELHKICPAWGIEYYMSGKLLTKELEEQTKDKRERERKRINSSI